MNETHWRGYEYPYASAPVELADALARLDVADSSEEVEQLLYGEVLGLVLHQGDLYSGVVPLVDALRGSVERRDDPSISLSIVSFVEYLLARPIRDACHVLVRPHRYGACEGSRVARSTIDARDRLACLFGDLVAPRLPAMERAADIYYRHVLCPSKLDAGIERALRELPLASDAYASLVIAMRLRVELWGGGAERLGALRPPPGLDEPLRVLLEVYRAPTQALEAELCAMLTQDLEVPWYWASGSLAVIGAVGLVLAARQRSEPEQVALLERLVSVRAELVARHADDEVELEFAVPEAMLEDVSTLVFLAQMGRETPLAVTDMTALQRRWFELLADEAKTHTHAMLYAGVLPRGMTPGEANAVGEIHRCYQRRG